MKYRERTQDEVGKAFVKACEQDLYFFSIITYAMGPSEAHGQHLLERLLYLYQKEANIQVPDEIQEDYLSDDEESALWEHG